MQSEKVVMVAVVLDHTGNNANSAPNWVGVGAWAELGKKENLDEKILYLILGLKKWLVEKKIWLQKS